MKPPFLVIRKGVSFWVEHRPPDSVSATLQPFQEGCYKASCYDGAGFLWPILNAVPKTPPVLLHRILPWRQLPVSLQLGDPIQTETSAVVSQLKEILNSGNEFCDNLRHSANEVLKQLEEAKSPTEIIRIADAEK